jgi:hypothetical protein
MLMAGCWGGCGDDNSVSADAGADGLKPDQKCPASIGEFRSDEDDGLLSTDPETGISVRVVDASPKMPGVDFNTWTIAVTDSNGEPMPQVHLTWACAWMAVHGHGSNPRMLNRPGDGRFELKQMNLAMYGAWQVQLWLDPDSAAPDFVPQGGSTVDQNRCLPTNGSALSPNIKFDICVRKD